MKRCFLVTIFMMKKILISYHFFQTMDHVMKISLPTGWWVSTHLMIISQIGSFPQGSRSENLWSGAPWKVWKGCFSYSMSDKCWFRRKIFPRNHSTQPCHCKCDLIYLQTDWPGDFSFLISRFFFPLKSTLDLSKPTRKSSICRWTFPIRPKRGEISSQQCDLLKVLPPSEIQQLRPPEKWPPNPH